ncbi:alpha/beta hydrolase [Nocardioides bruguierae]|uniref:Alpha/beta hydrolase n=1 Tax=Nocardioides bruguierae TaxID=2945102 RepID=A0A9X2D5P9_9ACTN|nr:alpha/beta hydrolase [Nocardioides bruguierae]MCL8026467.1 alpha/beta hydrolase [Nocardioides bruguierae]MCM0619798.1 alpha/beta hydrolase [Nocardioides bruguierae]
MLHPQARAAVAAYASETKVHDDDFDIDAARAEARALASRRPREAVAEVRDVDAGGVPCRLYRPVDARPGLVLHLHGGGFVMNDVEVHDAVSRRFANRLGHPVLSIDYRRPPEHRFPAAPDDVDTVLAWLAAHAEDEGLTGPLAAHGDSAGGNLALVAALRHPGRFAAIALTYPFLDPEGGFESYRTAADGFHPDEARWYWDQYAASSADLVDPDLAPLRSTRLHTLPPTLVTTAEHDPLRDEGEHLVTLLAEAGVTVTGTRYQGQVHGYWRHPDVFDAAAPHTAAVAGFLAEHLRPAPPPA